MGLNRAWDFEEDSLHHRRDQKLSGELDAPRQQQASPRACAAAAAAGMHAGAGAQSARSQGFGRDTSSSMQRRGREGCVWGDASAFCL